MGRVLAWVLSITIVVILALAVVGGVRRIAHPLWNWAFGPTGPAPVATPAPAVGRPPGAPAPAGTLQEWAVWGPAASGRPDQPGAFLTRQAEISSPGQFIGLTVDDLFIEASRDGTRLNCSMTAFAGQSLTGVKCEGPFQVGDVITVTVRDAGDGIGIGFWPQVP